MQNDAFDVAQCDVKLSAKLVEAVTRALGTPRFGRQLLDAFDELVRVDHCAVFIKSEQGTLRMLATASRAQQSNGARAALRYMSEMHSYDGVGSSRDADSIGSKNVSLEDGSVRVMYRTRDQISHTAYRAVCYEQVGIEDRLSMSRDGNDS